MTTYFTDFSDNSTTDWVEDWNATFGALSATGGILSVNLTGLAKYGARFNPAGTAAGDVEIVAKVRSSATAGFQNWLVLCGSTGVNGYVCAFSAGTSLKIFRYNTGTYTQLSGPSNDTYTFAWSANTWYWVRFGKSGTTVRAKVWADGDVEPGSWGYSDTDATPLADGYFAIGANDATGTKDFDLVGMGTGGDAAPTTAPVTMQTLAPASDVTTTGWTTTGAASPFAALDEASASDADYVTSPASPSGSVLEVKFASAVDPNISTGHSVAYRLRALGTSHSVVVGLYQGATLVGGGSPAQWTHTALTSSFQTFTQALSSAQADTITDYTDLRLRVTATAS